MRLLMMNNVFLLLSRITVDAVCDATYDDTRTKAGNKILIKKINKS